MSSQERGVVGGEVEEVETLGLRGVSMSMRAFWLVAWFLIRCQHRASSDLGEKGHFSCMSSETWILRLDQKSTEKGREEPNEWW